MRAAVVEMRGALFLILALLYPAAVLSASPAAATHTVVMEGTAFVPATLTVRRGDTVVWVNKDMFPHTATAQDGSFDSGAFAPNRTWKYMAAKNGTFPYVCTLHPTMKGVLVVE
jgi:plastocyanin